MQAYFDMDESTLLQMRKAVKEGKIAAPADGESSWSCWGWKTRTAIRTRPRSISSTTRSTPPRAASRSAAYWRIPRWYPQAHAPARRRSSPEGRGEMLLRPPAGRRASPGARRATLAAATVRLVPRQFKPGMFVRVRQPIGDPHPALLVIDRAILSDQGNKYVYVVDKKNKVQPRSIKTGGLQEDGLRVVEGEIKADDWVVVGGTSKCGSKWKSSRTQPAHAVAHRHRGRATPVAKGTVARERWPRQRCPVVPQTRGRSQGNREDRSTMISRFFIDRPIFATVLSVVITLIGGISLFSCRSRSIHASRRRA